MSRAKPRILRGQGGWWLCAGGAVCGSGKTPFTAYRAWLYNMVHHGTSQQLAEYGLTA